MIVHVYTDASVKEQAGAWGMVAIWPSCERKKIEASGVMRDDCKCSTAAELRAIGNALYHLVDGGHVTADDAAKVFCDNQSAVDRLNGTITRVRGRDQDAPWLEAMKWIKSFVVAHSLVLEVQWVKGHRPINAYPGSAHNRRADKLAGECIDKAIALRRARIREEKALLEKANEEQKSAYQIRKAEKRDQLLKRRLEAKRRDVQRGVIPA